MSKIRIKSENKNKSKGSKKTDSYRFRKETTEQKIFSRFKLTLEYEGTRYSGWQKQQNARTIQGELVKACKQIFGDGFVDLQGSGRTDSGVHSMNQVAHLDANTMLASHVIMIKLNDLLPHDINILDVEKVNKNFHARHSAKSRTYLYKISIRRNAFEKNHIWWVKDKLNFQAMEKAAKLFSGMNDFISFSDEDPEEKSTKVAVDDIKLFQEGDLILIRITGSHFIWKMVRRIVGVLVEVGRGKKSEKDILFYLNNKSGEPAKYTAPPSGLFLEKVIY